MNIFADQKIINIGVLCENSEEKCLAKWKPLEEYLNSLSSRKHNIIPLFREDIRQSIETGKIDFLISNPLLFLELEDEYRIKNANP